MVSPFPPQASAVDDRNATLRELGDFLHQTNRNIERILHSFASRTPLAENATLADASKGATSSLPPSPTPAAAPAVTRSLLPNIGLATVDDRSDSLGGEDMAREGDCRDGSSALRTFMEEIAKTSSYWCAKHRGFLGEKGSSLTADSANSKEPSSSCPGESKNRDMGLFPEDEMKGSTKVQLTGSSSLSSVDEANKGVVNPLVPAGKNEKALKTRTGPEDIRQSSRHPCEQDGDYVVKLTMGCEEAEQNGDVDADDGDGAKDGCGNVSQLPMDGYTTPLPSTNHEDKVKNASSIPHESSADMSIQPYRRPVEVIDSPDWLPEGWITELRVRGTGNSAGSKDKYYIDPETNRRFRSRKDVFDFIETGKLNRQRKKPGTSPLRRFPEAPSLIPPKQPSKKVKSREDAMPHTSMSPITSSFAINNTNHNTASAAMSNNLFPPFRSQQPTSEWLMYESLASLPFPVYDTFRYGDANVTANKSTINKAPQGPPPAATRPWFFSGPDTSWMPFSNIGKAGNNRVAETQNAYAMPPPPPSPSYTSDFAQKKRIRKTKRSLA